MPLLCKRYDMIALLLQAAPKVHHNLPKAIITLNSSEAIIAGDLLCGRLANGDSCITFYTRNKENSTNVFSLIYTPFDKKRADLQDFPRLARLLFSFFVLVNCFFQCLRPLFFRPDILVLVLVSLFEDASAKEIERICEPEHEEYSAGYYRVRKRGRSKVQKEKQGGDENHGGKRGKHVQA